MMRLKHSDITIEASDAEGVVQQMRSGAHDGGGTDRGYMDMVADRARVQTGKAVRTDSYENFVADLVAAGLLEEVEG